jgi:hypothetical protein
MSKERGLEETPEGASSASTADLARSIVLEIADRALAQVRMHNDAKYDAVPPNSTSNHTSHNSTATAHILCHLG